MRRKVETGNESVARDVWLIGGGGLGLVLALFKRPWWSVPLLVSIVTLFMMSAKEWASVAEEPVWLIHGILFYSLPALIGWVVGRLLHGLAGK